VDFNGNHQPSSYAVEVSGWDPSEAFFVEKTNLTWTADGMKEITLGRPIREGSMIFVRLMQDVSNTDNYPIACQAVKVMEQSGGCRTTIQVSRLRPREFFKDTTRTLSCADARAA
jgi:hypothetical protein